MSGLFNMLHQQESSLSIRFFFFISYPHRTSSGFLLDLFNPVLAPMVRKNSHANKAQWEAERGDDKHCGESPWVMWPSPVLGQYDSQRGLPPYSSHLKKTEWEKNVTIGSQTCLSSYLLRKTSWEFYKTGQKFTFSLPRIVPFIHDHAYACQWVFS